MNNDPIRAWSKRFWLWLLCDVLLCIAIGFAIYEIGHLIAPRAI